MLNRPPAPSSALALVTTLHLGLAVFHHHRRRLRRTAGVAAGAVSVCMSVLPWVLPSLTGLALGVGAHLVWIAACDVLIPTRPAAAATGTPAPDRGAGRPASRPAAAAPAPSRGFVSVPVLATFDETPSIKTIRLGRPEDFTFEAGQFVTVRIRADGREHARCYSISSAPEVRGYLEISVKRQGIVSSALHATARPGATLSVKRPGGAFRYPSGDDRPIVLLAGGIGITPLISMLRHAASVEPSRPATLLYGAHTEGDFAFADELAVLARRHPQIRVHLAAAREATRSDVYPGRIDEALIRATAPDIAHSIVLLCGPTPMIDAMKATLAGLGVPPGQVRQEIFQAAVAAAAGLDGEHHASPGHEHRMTCTRSGRTVPVHAGQTLLEAAESGGIEIDSLCRSGVCGTCRVQVSDGEVDCRSAMLEPDDRARGVVLACVSNAVSDCVVNL
jgi:ferredoxin-NADP reductase